MRVEVAQSGEEVDHDAELRRGLLSKGREISTFRRYYDKICSWLGYFIAFIFICAALFSIIFSFIAYHDSGAGERMRNDPESCTKFPRVFVSFMAASLVGICLIPCCIFCQDNDSNIAYCWVAFQHCWLLITMLSWVIEYFSVNQSESCKTYVQDFGSDLFWDCCSALAMIFLPTLCLEMFGCVYGVMSLIFCVGETKKKPKKRAVKQMTWKYDGWICSPPPDSLFTCFFFSKSSKILSPKKKDTLSSFAFYTFKFTFFFVTLSLGKKKGG